MENAKSILMQTVAMLKAHYQHILSAVLIITSILVVYGNDLTILVNEALQSEALSHILLIPFFVGVLLYLKKDMVKASLALEKHKKKTKIQYVDEVIGIAFCLIAFLVYWYGSYTFYPLEYHLLSLPIFTLGITLILFNLKVLFVLIFPILFLLFLTPLPSEFLYTIGGAMANFNTQASYALLKALSLPVTLSSSYGPPTIILTTSAGQPTSFAIDLACSGIYSFIAFAMFATFLAFIASTSIPKKIGLFLLGFLMFEVLNIIRITTIISIAYSLGEEIAMFIFHSVAGLVLIFIGMLLTLLVAEKALKIPIITKPQKQPMCPRCKTSLQNLENFCMNCGKHLTSFRERISRRFWMKLILLLLGCSIVTFSIHAPTLAVAQETIEITSGSENTSNVFPQTLEYQDVNYTLEFLDRDTDFEKIAGQDASLTYAYFPDNWSKAVVYTLVGVSSSLSNLHSWEVCLITWQTAHGHYPLVTVLDSRDTQLLEGTPIIARYLVFSDTRSGLEYTQVTLYWYERITFHTGLTIEPKYARISLIILTYNSENYQQYEAELLKIGRDIASAWEPLKTQSLISLGIPAQQLLLILSIGFVAFTKTTQYFVYWREKANNQKIFNNFASAKEKLVLQTIQTLNKETKETTLQAIYHSLKRTTSNKIELEEVADILNSLENYGIIKKDISNVQNNPKLIWKY